MTFDEVRALILAFPGTVEATSYGTPGFRAGNKFLTRLRSEDDSLVLLDVGFDEREMLMEAEPQTFHITEHYRNYPSVLARIESVHPGTLRGLIERRWRNIAPKRLIKAWEEAAAG